MQGPIVKDLLTILLAFSLCRRANEDVRAVSSADVDFPREGLTWRRDQAALATDDFPVTAPSALANGWLASMAAISFGEIALL